MFDPEVGTDSMELNDPLHQSFLEHLQELESFRMAYAATHPDAPLDRDDPDVKRLLEAVAFFAARTHRAGMRNIVTEHLRLFQQCFGYLLTPLPAMGLLKARPTGQFIEPLVIPKGCEFAFTPAEGESGIFRTLEELRVLPLRLEEADRILLPAKGYRVRLVFSTPYPRNDEIGTLGLHTDHLNDDKASMLLFHQLRLHLKGASVVFGEKASEESRGEHCEVTFGRGAAAEEDWLNPLERERRYFHYPRQDLYLHVKVPSPPRNWSRFTVCLDLDEKWPRNLIINRENFHLFTVPVINLKRSMASPVICEGLKERYPIRYPERRRGFELHSVQGVYISTGKGLVNLRPGILAGGSGTYETEQTTSPDLKERSHWLILNFPEAFDEPRTVSVDALWLQPGFSQAAGQRLRIAPYDRSTVGLDWEIFGEITPHAVNRFGGRMDNFMHLFTLKNKAILDLDDLSSLLRSLGSPMSGVFKEIGRRLETLRVEKAPPRKGDPPGMQRLVHHFRFSGIEFADRPLAEAFTDHAGRILDAWLSHAIVTAKIETVSGGGGTPSPERSGP